MEIVDCITTHPYIYTNQNDCDLKRPKLPRNDDPLVFTIVLWWLGNLVFGLIPLLTVGLIKMCNLNSKSDHISTSEIVHFLKDGGLNFFFLAIIGSIAVDIYSARKKFNFHFAGIMILLGIGIGIVVSFIYMAFILTTDDHSHFGDMKPLTIGLGITAFIYCTVGKISLTLKEKK